MRSNLRIGGSALTTFAVVASACYGAVQDQDQPELVGERAALVQKKLDWLLNYDRHCGVCFDAFTLCEKGAADGPDAANCKAALDACVRGGLINDADGGASEADAGDAPAQDGAIADAAIVDEADAAEEQDADQASGDGADAGAATCVARPASPFDALDAGRRRGIGAGRDAGVECPPQAIADAAVTADAGAAEEVDEVSDAEIADDEPVRDAAPAGGGRPGRASNPLEDSVSVCLEATEICLDGSASAQDCVAALRDCVRVALERTFDDVCSVQVAACRAEGAPAAATRSVEGLCSDDLPFDAPTR